MLNIYQTVEGQVVLQERLTPGCWVNVTEPTQQEIEYLTGELGLDTAPVPEAGQTETQGTVAETSDAAAEEQPQAVPAAGTPLRIHLAASRKARPRARPLARQKRRLRRKLPKAPRTTRLQTMAASSPSPPW